MDQEESFKDLKSLLDLGKLIALMLLAYAIGLLVGEKLRNRMCQGGKKMEALFGPLHPAEAAGKIG